jgi:23S rRNA (guanosine2251-2'-O)-methyltransferase
MIQIEGRNPVYEAIRSGKVLRVKIAKEVEKENKIRKIISLLAKERTPFEFTRLKELNKISLTGRHQGVVAYVKQPEILTLDEFLRDSNRDVCILLLIQIQDPHNLGAILRTAECSGVDGVVIAKKKSVGVTPTVHRISMGGSIYVPVFREKLRPAIKLLRDEGFRIIGVDSSGSLEYFKEDLTGAIAFILGGEDRGVNPILLNKCDNVVSIPTLGRIQSLNVSVAVSIVLYERLRQKILNS